MITKDTILSAYAFFHQKWRVYDHSNMDWQKDDIEYAISNYTETMNPELYQLIARNRTDYLRSHSTFAEDLSEAVDLLETMI